METTLLSTQAIDFRAQSCSSEENLKNWQKIIFSSFLKYLLKTFVKSISFFRKLNYTIYNQNWHVLWPCKQKKCDHPSKKNWKKYKKNDLALSWLDNNNLHRGCQNSFSFVQSVDRSQQVCSQGEYLLLKIWILPLRDV